MSRRVRTIMVIAAAALFGVWVLSAVARAAYFTPRSEKLAQIEKLTGRVESMSQVNRVARTRQLQAYADQTLGGERETADHQFRSHLNRLTEQHGLVGASVGTADTSARLSPARTEFSRQGLQGEMRDQIDLIEIEGWINAEGSIEQVLAMIDSLNAQPWLKQLDQVKLSAKENGERCAVSIRLTTLLLPGYEPSREHEVQDYDEARLARFVGLLNANPFALPKPEPPVRTAEGEDPPPKPEFPYGQWSLTGTALGPDGVEAWLLQQTTGETRRLLVGQSIGNARLLAAEGENARFVLNQQQFLVSIGATLIDRAPVQP